LRSGIRPIDDLIRIREHYDYTPEDDDPGREYYYTVRVARADLDELVATLAAKADGSDLPADPEQALMTCVRTLVDTGRLPTRDLKTAYATMQGWLDGAGIPHSTEPWAWLNSD
jgi:hypothetical protein